MLRALHRRTAPCPAHYKTWWPWCTFARSDAVSLPRGTPIEITFGLLPVGWVFKAGGHMRLAVAAGIVITSSRCRTGARRVYVSTIGIAHPSRLLLLVRSGV
jgi:hypothetical protein